MGRDGVDAAEIEDVLDRLEAWHRSTGPGDGTAVDDRSEAPTRR